MFNKIRCFHKEFAEDLMNEIADRRNTTRAEIDIYSEQDRDEIREYTRISEKSTSLIIEVYETFIIIDDLDSQCNIHINVNRDDEKSLDDFCESVAITYNSLIDFYRIEE